jgi:hypothetical protein
MSVCLQTIKEFDLNNDGKLQRSEVHNVPPRLPPALISPPGDGGGLYVGWDHLGVTLTSVSPKATVARYSPWLLAGDHDVASG